MQRRNPIRAASERNPLAAHTAPREAGAAFCATRESGLAIVAPLTPAAASWLRDYVDPEASWLADGVAVELRAFPQLAEAIIAAGFTFERDAYPN